MILQEFFESPKGWQNVEDDHSQPEWGESRKTRLTLGEISKMRRMYEVAAFEKASDLKRVRKMYAPAGNESGPSL